MKRKQFELNFELELSHWWFVGRRSIFESIITQILPPSDSSVIVEIGCGTGGNLVTLSRSFTCIGIDPSCDAIELAQSRCTSACFVVGTAPEMLYDTAKAANLYILADVLEHVPDDYYLLSSTLAHAQPGSYFLLTVPAMRCLWSGHDETHAHFRRYERSQFEDLWHSFPVTPLLVSHFNSRLYPIVRLARTLNRMRRHTSGFAGTDLAMPAAWVNRSLTSIFRGEAQRLKAVLHGSRVGYRSGVSLIALLRRDQGAVTPRRKPPHAPPDMYQPTTRIEDLLCRSA